MKATMTPTQRPLKKNRHKSPLRRPGAVLAPISTRRAAASLHGYAWQESASGGFQPAAEAARTAESQKSALKPCPFCGLADRLEIMDWTHERRDGTESEGDAVKCNRCDAIAPVGVWQGATPAPAKGSEVQP
jgi:hypothetical protein